VFQDWDKFIISSLKNLGTSWTLHAYNYASDKTNLRRRCFSYIVEKATDVGGATNRWRHQRSAMIDSYHAPTVGIWLISETNCKQTRTNDINLRIIPFHTSVQFSTPLPSFTRSFREVPPSSGFLWLGLEQTLSKHSHFSADTFEQLDNGVRAAARRNVHHEKLGMQISPFADSWGGQLPPSKRKNISWWLC